MNSDLLDQLMDPKSPINVDGLLDAITALVIDCKIPSLKNKNLETFVTRYQKIVEQLSNLRPKGTDFRTLKVIGRGSFGEVQLVRHITTNQIYAMKLLNKDCMLQRSASIWEERDVMAHADSDWIVKLHYAFQDQKSLYIVMEYMPGGDLLNLIANYGVSEKWARFYTAELVEALSCVHEMGYIHRDVKPENVLITKSGHIKLADFGTCIKMNEDGSAKCLIAVGTSEYLAPEVLRHQGNDVVFGREVDWWSLGICIYEMLYNYTPFSDESMTVLYNNITKHEKTLKYPDEPQISPHTKDIITRFLSKAEIRLGRNGPDEIRAHPFFKNIEWTFDTLRKASPPFVPELDGDEDTRNFEEIEVQHENSTAPPLSRIFNGNQLPFIGFTFANDLSPINIYKELSKLKEKKGKENVLQQIPISPNQGVQKELETQLTIMKNELDQVRNLLENEQAARRTAESSLSEIENDKVSHQEEVVEENRKLKIKLETAQHEKRSLIRKLEEVMAKRIDDPKGPSKSDIKNKDTKIRRLEADKASLMLGMERKVAENRDLESELYNLRLENDKLTLEMNQVKAELKRKAEMFDSKTDASLADIHQGCFAMKKGRKDWIDLWATLDSNKLCMNIYTDGVLDSLFRVIDVSKIIHVRHLTAADIKVKEEQLKRMFQIMYDTETGSKSAKEITLRAPSDEEANDWINRLKKLIPEKKVKLK